MLTASSSSLLLRPAACCCTGRGRKQRHGWGEGNSRAMKEATFTRGSRKTTAFGDKQGRESDRLFRTLYSASGGNMSPPSPFFSPSPLPSPPRQSTNCCAQYMDALPSLNAASGGGPLLFRQAEIDISPPSPPPPPYGNLIPPYSTLSRPLHPPLPPPFTNDKSMLTTWRKGKEGRLHSKEEELDLGGAL